MKTPLIASILTLAVTSTAHADVPPPSGQKYVSYIFKIQGLDAYSDQVVVAWPWSTSNGAPTREYTVVPNDSAISVGRRSPSVKLYAVAKTDWEAFASSVLGNAQPDNDEKVNALNAFLAPPKAASCDQNPSPRHMISESDPRDTVEEVFIAKAIGASACTLERVSEPVASGSSGCSGGGLGFGWAAALLAFGGLATRRFGRRRSQV